MATLSRLFYSLHVARVELPCTWCSIAILRLHCSVFLTAGRRPLPKPEKMQNLQIPTKVTSNNGSYQSILHHSPLPRLTDLFVIYLIQIYLLVLINISVFDSKLLEAYLFEFVFECMLNIYIWLKSCIWSQPCTGRENKVVRILAMVIDYRHCSILS